MPFGCLTAWPGTESKSVKIAASDVRVGEWATKRQPGKKFDAKSKQTDVGRFFFSFLVGSLWVCVCWGDLSNKRIFYDFSEWRCWCVPVTYGQISHTHTTVSMHARMSDGLGDGCRWGCISTRMHLHSRIDLTASTMTNSQRFRWVSSVFGVNVSERLPVGACFFYCLWRNLNYSKMKNVSFFLQCNCVIIHVGPEFWERNFKFFWTFGFRLILIIDSALIADA